jgi:outer membrane receptor protein involved in Fe transport
MSMDVLDLAITKTLRQWVDLNVGIENLTDKHYYETQNFFESRVSPTAEAIERIHGTPGYPFGITVGLTFRIAGKR